MSPRTGAQGVGFVGAVRFSTVLRESSASILYGFCVQ
jgi:hypothetical protein